MAQPHTPSGQVPTDRTGQDPQKPGQAQKPGPHTGPGGEPAASTPEGIEGGHEPVRHRPGTSKPGGTDVL